MEERFKQVTTGPKFRYTGKLAATIESYWQNWWKENNTFAASNPVGDLADDSRPLSDKRKFILDMFPYPSGAGLHVGHVLGFVATDVYARYCRMNQTNVLYTMGFDAFGLPAEQYAIETGTHPKDTTNKNINRYLKQIEILGLSHDIRRRISTTDVDFYHWTQWIFLKIYNAWYDTNLEKARPIVELINEFETGIRKVGNDINWNSLTKIEQHKIIDKYRLVYQTDSYVNWCPGLGTVLANEEVTAEGKSEKGNFPVYRKKLKQWSMRITKYADRLLEDLQDLDWPSTIKTMQQNWIGKSVGAQVIFNSGTEKINVYTTRVDTLFGVSYLVLAPENPLVDKISAIKWPDNIPSSWKYNSDSPKAAINKYRLDIATKTDLERTDAKTKTGVFIGAYAVHPFTKTKLPIFIADYVLSSYGTGAVMGVPGHDERDKEFAQKYNLKIISVINSSGNLINSADFSGLNSVAAKVKILSELEKIGVGFSAVQYKLRDWLFARQRYWGEPLPIVFDEDGLSYPLPETELPIRLPNIANYNPTTFAPDDFDSQPTPPLSRIPEWLNVELDLGEGMKNYYRDANVMPQWAGSSWYQLRYADPHNQDFFCAPENEKYWLGPKPEIFGENDLGGVDLYIGGAEHAVLHLLYARFWHKVLFDLGYVSAKEPFRKLFNQGYIQAYAYKDNRGMYVPAADVEFKQDKYFYRNKEVIQEYGKIGKSLKNSVTPDELCAKYGADTLRVYEMSMGPLEASKPWSTKDIIGAHRFLQRVWRLIVDEETGTLRIKNFMVSENILKQTHKTIKEVAADYEALKFNTAVAKLIELTNLYTKEYKTGLTIELAKILILLLAPLAPHIAEEIWKKINQFENNTSLTSLSHTDFPVYNEKYLQKTEVFYSIQVQGKFKTKIKFSIGSTETEVVKKVLSDSKIAPLLQTQPKKIIFIPDKLVNIVI